MDTKKTHRAISPRYLFYSVDGSIYTSKLDEIKEVVTDLVLDEVPMRNDFTIGMSSLRGEIFSILSLGKLLSISSSTSRTATQHTRDEEHEKNLQNMVTLIVEHNDLKYGLVVDSIRQVGVLDTDNLKESDACDWIYGHYKVGIRISTVLNLKSLLESEYP